MRSFPLYLAALCLLVPLFLVSCGGSDTTRRIDLTNLKIHQNPAETPGDLPGLFLYPDTPIKMAISYGGSRYVMSSQSVILQEVSASRAAIMQHYTKAFQTQGWQIIQSSQTEAEALILAESPSRRLATVILRGQDPVQVKFYFKRASLF